MQMSKLPSNNDRRGSGSPGAEIEKNQTLRSRMHGEYRMILHPRPDKSMARDQPTTRGERLKAAPTIPVLRRKSDPSVAARPSAPPPPGALVAGRYRLEHVLQQGGMGAVFRAHDLRLDVDVAVKLVRGDIAGPDATERLIKEGRALAHISHPAAVRVIDVGMDEHSDPFLVMELLRGTSLAEVLAARGSLTPEEAVRVLLPIVDAVAAAHAAGIVHRDIKPQNIMLVRGEDGADVPKLVDFGVARLTAEPHSARLTRTGMLLGSLEYMAPEQTEGHIDVDVRADVWALCVVLFELVTGRTPFHRQAPLATLRAIQSEDPEPSGVLFHELGLRDILRWGLAKARNERWSSARELGQALAWWAIARGIEADVASTSLTSRWGAGLNAPPPRGSEPANAPRHGEQPPTACRRVPTILVADDDPVQRAAIRAVLMDEDYDVVEASDGDAVLRLLGSAAVVPDVLLLDFCMPGFSGLGVLRLLQKRGAVPPTFIVTSFPDSSVDRMAAQLGALRVIHKPVNLDELCAEVRTALSRSSNV
jgi:eukaryotic-like serine/threonine-protein kinase